VTESVIADDKPGDEVGAIRRFLYAGNWLRQRLGDHSNAQRSLSYAGIDPFPFPDGVVVNTPPPARYEETMHLLRIVDGTRTFIEWSVALDAGPKQADSWHDLPLSLIAQWPASLRRTLARYVPQNR
jgi:hypothetical protein